METSSPRRDAGSATRPAGIAHGPGHVVVYGNPAFRAAFGEGAVGLPARESMLGLPSSAFALLDLVYAEGRAFARWIRRDGEVWRLTAVPRRDVETGDVYGLAFHLRARDDLPIVVAEDDATS
jgi:PAS domain-containing protein